MMVFSDVRTINWHWGKIIFTENHVIPNILIYLSQVYSLLYWLIDTFNLCYLLIKIQCLLFDSDNQKLMTLFRFVAQEQNDIHCSDVADNEIDLTGNEIYPWFFNNHTTC